MKVNSSLSIFDAVTGVRSPWRKQGAGGGAVEWSKYDIYQHLYPYTNFKM